ncbi:hypothetical protein GCM10010505_55090 [Kitasatospora aburaviensis]
MSRAPTPAAAVLRGGPAEQPQYVTKPCPGDQQYYPADVPEKFWECSNGTAYLFDCPAGLHWDTELLTCNYPEAAGWEPPAGRTSGGRRSASLGSEGMQRLETKHIQGQVITHTIVKPLL